MAVEEFISKYGEGGKDRFIREPAARALGEIGDKKAVDHLIQALNDDAEMVIEGSIYALGKIGCNKAVNPLARILKKGPYGILFIKTQIGLVLHLRQS